MLVTPSGIVIEVNEVQFWNAYSSMLVTPSGIVIVVNLEQSANAERPMLVTLAPLCLEGTYTTASGPL